MRIKQLFCRGGCCLTEDEYDSYFSEEDNTWDDYKYDLATVEEYLDNDNCCCSVKRKDLVNFGEMIELEEGYFKVEEDYSLTRVEQWLK